ncbi:MurR/RpiR family transcriptional regulator [Ochrobactrum sp. BD22]
MEFANFDERVATYLDRMSPAEQRVARFFQEHKEEVLFASAASLAAKAETSDATVVRTTKALGFQGMNDLRRSLAAEVKQTLSLSSRLTETLSKVGDDLQAAFDLTIDIHLDSIGNVRRNITPQLFQAAIQLLEKGRRIVIFGIGPSSAIAVYLATQLGRFGLDVQTLTRTGLLFADDVRKLRPGDVVLAMAYTHVYRELAVLLDEADRRGIPVILLTDSLGGKLRDRVDVVLQVERGRAEMLSMHTATLGLLEAMLVGIAVKRPHETIQNLDDLNRLREEIAGESFDAPTRIG